MGLIVTPELLIVGALLGLTYGVLASGLILVYRSSGVVNFAHGQVGAFGAAVLARLVLNGRVPYLVALPAALAIGAGLGATIEFLIVRRLGRQPRVVLLVATIGISELLLVAETSLPKIRRVAAFPTPIHRTLTVGSLVLDGRSFMVVALVPAIVTALALFLSRTPTGLAVRAGADNADAAQLAGIGTRRIATTVWAIAGVVATFTVILINPLQGLNPSQVTPALGPALLLRALAAGLAGRLRSLPRALIGGVVIGMVEAFLQANEQTRGFLTSGFIDAVLLVVVLVTVTVGGEREPVRDTGSSAATLEARSSQAAPSRSAPRLVRWAAAHPGATGWILLSTVAVGLPVVVTNPGSLYLVTRMLLYALVGLSLTVLTGWSGQLSLGQIAFFGLGALCTAALTSRGVPFAAAVVEGGIAGVFASLLLGVPALRVRGLFLAITTLGFAVAAQSWLFGLGVFGGPDGVLFVAKPALGRFTFGYRPYYWLCLAVVGVASAAIARLRTTGVARGVIAAESNADRAAALGVSPTIARLSAFAIAGGLAALAGGLFAGLKGSVGFADFGVYESLAVVSIVVIGGLGSVPGALLGAAFVLGIPAIFGSSTVATFLTSSVGLLVVLLYLPGGIASVLALARQQLAFLAPVQNPAPIQNPLPAAARTVASTPPAPALRALGVRVSFGGVLALGGVDFEAAPGEVVGLIGSNGAGKSTLLDVLGGLIKPDAGVVSLDGLDITAASPEQRARLGVGRVFQDARLFGTLTVLETISVALESADRSELVPSLLALPPSRRAERAKRSISADLVSTLGLGAYAYAPVASLSTGTRRVVELACLLAQRAQVLLLDEPTAGLAQRETEAFAPLLLSVRDELHATLVIVEHDLPLVLSVSDRVQCLSAGLTIANAAPAAIRDDPAVIAAYLGTDERAIARSGAAAQHGPGAIDHRSRPLRAAGRDDAVSSSSGRRRRPPR
ncbi:MAG: branched-chain amino acid ABC transporter permease/ATP-binding protein [Acidimicrobiales bacterium]